MFGRNKKQDPVPGQGPDAGVDAKDTTTAELTTAQTTTSTGTTSKHPTGIKLALVLSSVYCSLFLVSLDRLIISTAIPAITNEFDSLPDVGWYGAAYLLTSCAFQLLFGKLYSFYSIRIVYGSSVLLFEIGSAICGSAPNSIAFIFGRAIQGVGSAGLYAGVIVVIVYAVPLHRRPFFQGLGGAVFGVSSILGPLVGGALTSNVTWRWCFYINLPFGAVVIVVVAFFLRIPDREETKLSTKAKLSQLDAAGTTALVPAVVSLLLALEWGGLQYAWNDRRVIALLTLGVFLSIVFILVQIFMPATATIPPRIFKQRSILAGFWTTTVLGSQMIIFVYFLPIWFQAIQGVSAVASGIRLLPTTLSIVVSSILNGILITKIGYYTPTMILGTAIVSVGAGLLNTLQLDSGAGKWIGYQIVYGLGQGLCFQAPSLAAQTVLPKKDVSIGASLMFFSQILGGAIFISVGQNVLNGQLLERLRHLPGFSVRLIQAGGATSLIDAFPPEYRHEVLYSYNESLRAVFRVGLILATFSVLGSAAMEWRSVKKGQKGYKDVEADAGAGANTSTNTDAEAAVKSDTDTLAPASIHHPDEKQVSEKSDGPSTPPLEK